MSSTWRFLGLSLLCAALVACGDDMDTDGGPGDMDSGAPTDAGEVDAGGGDTDAGPADDGGAADDGGVPDDGGPDTDAGTVPPGDAGAMCNPTNPGGACGSTLGCECCPAGGPAMACLCTTRCRNDTQCTDPARPRCNRPDSPGSEGICTPEVYGCAWGAICASPDTPILTPTGERPIAELAVGDLVLTLDGGRLVARPIEEVTRMAVTDHAVVRVELETGRVLEISGPHPTADGTPFSALAPGDTIDGTRIEAVRTVPYAHAFTHDIRPAGDTGTYVAGGVLIGTTIPRDR